MLSHATLMESTLPLLHKHPASLTGLRHRPGVICMSSQGSLIPISDSSTFSSGWPRRASKACASCRRDKIRCDGARPCGGCAKKGYTVEECKYGCDPCRRARVRCEDGKPCQRCRMMQLECRDETTMSILRSSTPPAAPRSMRGSADRAKLACSSCRRDNKKCDDQRPCSRCTARSEECVHVGRGPKLVKLRCEGCREDNKRCEDPRPCKYCVESNKPCVLVPRKGRGHGTRVKAACTNCRRDKIRCDGVRPCASCVRKNCECVERACKACSINGKMSDCTHRKSHTLSKPSGDAVIHNTTADCPSPSFSAVPTTRMTQAREQQYHAIPPASLPQQPFEMCLPSRNQHLEYYFQPQEMEISDQPDVLAPHNSLLTFLPDPQTNYYHSMGRDLGRYSHAMASNSRTFLPDN